ncbi:MAG: tyrosine-type recombinase/integrase [Maricaulaceae bacterium]
MSREPWNKDRQVGARKALSPDEIAKMRRHLSARKSHHDLCLFLVAIDTMLRASDLLRLRVSDVCTPDGKVRDSFPWKQKKTGQGVFPVLTPASQTALKKWIEECQKHFSDYLFTREKPRAGDPISVGFYRTLIKQWVRAVGLRPHDYSAHSLRRSKAIFMYENGVPVEIIGRLFGHTSSASTIHYLGIDEAEARARALANDIFGPKRSQKSENTTRLSDAELDYLSEQIWERIAPKLAELFDEHLNRSR